MLRIYFYKRSKKMVKLFITESVKEKIGLRFLIMLRFYEKNGMGKIILMTLLLLVLLCLKNLIMENLFLYLLIKYSALQTIRMWNMARRSMIHIVCEAS